MNGHNDTTTPPLPLLHDLFRKQAQSTPTAPALRDGSRSLTYRELDELTDRLSLLLRDDFGVRPDDNVVIYMNKSLEYVVSYISILKAGGAYLPLDVAYPPDLVEMILGDATPVGLLVGETYTPVIRGCQSPTPPLFEFSEGWMDRLPFLRAPLPPLEMTADNLAYVVYTSGTTGRPKGIECPHRGAVISYQWRTEQYPYKQGDREAANVFFVWELLRPLLSGAELYVIPDDVIYDMTKLPLFLKENGISRMLFTPSLLDAMIGDMDESSRHFFSSVSLIVLCGEVVTVALRNKCRKVIPNASIHNLYSISECHDVVATDLTDDSSLDLGNKFCPVGKCLPEVHIHVMDEEGGVLPPGLVGEVYVAGPTLARGYLGKPEMTAKRFVMVGDRGEAVRMYRTGDMGCMVPGGMLEIRGRCDSMVKVRGYSIELSAVQAAVLEIKDIVSDCVVVAEGDAADTDKTLVAFIVPAPGVKENSSESKQTLRKLLKQRLPFYMIPLYFVFLSTIPVHQASGKLDRKGLPSLAEVAAQDDDSHITPPSNPTETAIRAVFATVLNLETERVDICASFFDIGGHSLLTNPLLSQLEPIFSRKVELSELFAYPSVQELALVCQKNGSYQNGHHHQNLDLTQEVGKYYLPSQDGAMQLRSFWRHLSTMRQSSRILLTGSTGFLGSALLKELLMGTACSLLLLVRPEQNNGKSGGSGGGDTPLEKCQSRVWSALEEYGIASQEEDKDGLIRRAVFDDRVSVLVGDASLENLGLDPEDFSYLSQHVDLVVHAAAQVNLVYPYSALVGANVMGTANIVHFCNSGRIKPLHYISTDAVLPLGASHGVFDEDRDIAGISEDLHSGYAQSKWVAERIVSKAMADGLPGVVYRCGNLAAGGFTGAWNRKDSNLMLLQSCFAANAVPLTNDDETLLSLEMTPVDWVSKVVTCCVKHLRSVTQKTLHLMQPPSLRCHFGDVLRAAQNLGYDMKPVSLSEWVALSAASPARLPRGAFSAVEVEELCGGGVSFGQAQLGQIVATFGLEAPPRTSVSAVQKMVEALVAQQLLPAPPIANLKQPLAGKLIIVTGASSGIGAAVTKSLAAAGASVALFARRKKVLDAMLPDLGGSEKAAAFAVDVSDHKQVNAAIDEVEEHFKTPIWGLVNCAGVMHYQRILDGDQESWNQQIDVNCKGMVNCSGRVAQTLAKLCRGHIVSISSDAGRKVFSGLAVYSATKFFVEAYSQGLRTELAPLGVRVTTIQPGDVKTELLQHTRDQSALEEFGGGPDAEMLLPEEIADACVYAMTRRSGCAVNEILIEPTGCPA